MSASSWNNEFTRLASRQNYILTIVFIIAGSTSFMFDCVNGVLCSDFIFYLRIGLTIVGIVGIILTRLKIVKPQTMPMFYLYGMFAAFCYITSLTQDGFTIAINLGISIILYLFALTQMRVHYIHWIILTSVMLSVLIGSFLVSSVQSIQTLMNNGGLFAIISLCAMPVAGWRSYLNLKQTYILNKTIEEQKVQLEYYANYDPLTGVLNRRGGFLVFDKIINLEKRNKSNLCLAYVDLDDLKVVNDTQGHKAGDNLLKTFTIKLQQSIRKSDVICRVGGDEFIVLFPDCLQKEAESLIARISGNQEMLFSYGVACAEANDDLVVEDLINKADEHMYNMKKVRKRND